MNIFLLLIFAYLCGSVPFGKMVGHWYGVDIQRRGSGNIGFANVRRVLGWWPGLLTLAGDVAKGLAPTYLALSTAGRMPAFWVGLAAIAGHVFPVWLGFKGGKGIATGLGVVAVWQPAAAALGLVVYTAGSLLFKKSFIGSLLGAVAVGLVGVISDSAYWWQYLVLLVIAVITLRQNILGTLPNHDK